MNRKQLLPLFGIIFIGVGIFLTNRGIQTVRNAKASDAWPSTEGVVLSSEVERQRTTTRTSNGRHRNRTTYKASVLYQYDVDGRTYESDTVQFGGYSSNDPDPARRVVGAYPEGREVLVYYKPEEPAVSVLEPGTTKSSYLLLGMGVVFSFTGAGVLLRGLSGRV